MKKYLLTVLAVSTLTFTSCSKDNDELSKDDLKTAMKEAIKELNEEDYEGNHGDENIEDENIEDAALIGTWEANIFDYNQEPITLKYVFNNDKTFEFTETKTKESNTKKGTFFVRNWHSDKNTIVTTTKNQGDSYSKDNNSYEIVEGKLLLEQNYNNISIIEFTKK